MFTWNEQADKTEKNTQKDVLFLWRRIGDSNKSPFRMQEIVADLAFGSSNHSIIAVKTKRPFRGASFYSGG
jgi:hypothetical protein